MKKVYISATYNDLREHRSAVAHALRKMNYDVRCMEDYVATDERVDDRCRQDVASCDFYVGIIAHRYGWIPPGSDRSITEQEYMEARSRPGKTRCLMFLVDERTAWPREWDDALHDLPAAAKLAAFRSSLEGLMTTSFSSVESLVQEVMASVYMEDLKSWRMSLKREFDKVLDECRVKPAGTSGDHGDINDYKLLLQSSLSGPIIAAVTSAIEKVKDVRLVSIDLSLRGGWWSTRLHLLAGLLAAYTSVEKLVFFANGRCLGTCGPGQVRRALADRMPAIESALIAAMPMQHGMDATRDIQKIVQDFSYRLDCMGGEEQMKDNGSDDFMQVKAHIVEKFEGFNPECLTLEPGQEEIQLLPAILAKNYPFVPVQGDGETVVIDRVRLASQIASVAVARV